VKIEERRGAWVGQVGSGLQNKVGRRLPGGQTPLCRGT
jgi:hypothetical protein